MWTSKVGNDAKTLRLGLTQAGNLVTFASLTGPGGTGAPQLRMRLRHNPAAEALTFDLVAYTDTEVPALYNAEVLFTTADIPPGVYIAEVDATVSGDSVTFPDDRYILLRFLASVD